MINKESRNAQLRDSQKKSREKKKELGKKQLSISLDKSDYDKLRGIQKKNNLTYSEIIHNLLVIDGNDNKLKSLTIKLNGNSLFFLSKISEYKGRLFCYEEVKKSMGSLIKDSIDIVINNKLEPKYKVSHFSLHDCVSVQLHLPLKQINFLNSIEKCNGVSINHVINRIITIAYYKFVELYWSDEEDTDENIKNLKSELNKIIDCFTKHEHEVEFTGITIWLKMNFDLNNILTKLEEYLYLDKNSDKKIKEFYLRNYRTTQLELKV